MRVADAISMFREEVLPEVLSSYGHNDVPAVLTAWDQFVDYLQKSGEITEKQAYMWAPSVDSLLGRRRNMRVSTGPLLKKNT